MNDRDVRLLRLAVAVCQGDWNALRSLRRSAPPGEPDRGWREALLQAHLFAGIPRVVEAFDVLASAGGVGEPDADEALPLPERPAEGRRLFDRIYADQADPVRSNLAAHHPVLAGWIEGHAYGRVLTRDGLPAATRELLAVVSLAAHDQERQLASHVRGALRVGATPAEVEAALRCVEEQLGGERLGRALRVAASLAGDAQQKP